MNKQSLGIPRGPIINAECYLTKYLPRQYGSLRIGTIDAFRSMEGNQADPMDGRIKGLRIAGPVSFTSEEFNRTARNSSVQIHARDGIAFGDSGVFSDEVPRQVTNCYVYCCSCEFDTPIDPERIEHFKATYVAFINSPAAFAEHVGRNLINANARHIDGTGLDIKRVKYQYHYAPVRYLSREKPQVNELNNLDLFVYQKDPKFKLEQEYRFSWILFDTQIGRQIYVHPDPVYVPLPSTTVLEVMSITNARS